MKKFVVFILIFGGFHFLCSSQNIDSQKSNVEFKAANLGAVKVKGSFYGMKGSVKFDPKDIYNATFDVCIDATTINTKLKKRDQILKGSKYFDVNSYPEICFKSKSVSTNGMNYVLTGTLSMHGVSKEVDIIFNYSRKYFTGKLKVNRLDFNIGPNSGVFVGKEVDITINCVIN